jgi:uncharacterized protein YqgV (UPF0045/DUF77 family)
MLISAQVSLYPLRQDHLSPAIQAVGETLSEAGLQAHVGPMSTLVTGEADVLFAALRQAFLRAAGTGHVVMSVTLSNACPLGGSGADAVDGF